MNTPKKKKLPPPEERFTPHPETMALLHVLQLQIDDLQQELRAQERVLEFYANPEHWQLEEKEYAWTNGESRKYKAVPAHLDGGEQARRMFFLQQRKNTPDLPIKSASNINTWEDWPDDVRDLLQQLNKAGRLSFRRRGFGFSYELARQLGIKATPYAPIYQCSECQEYCQPHRSGVCTLDRNKYCDECMIEKVRGWLHDSGT